MQRERERQKCTGSRSGRKETSIPYTDEQWEMLRRGLRILARLIVRAHLRGQLPVYQPGPGERGGQGNLRRRCRRGRQAS